ncbi:MAG: MBL fold metallo-hydrolase, partial [Beijerinckiaceae bacterium]
MPLSRRTVLASTAAAAGLAALPPLASTGFAAAPPVGKQAPGFFRFKIGDFECTALHDGVVIRKVEQAYIPNAPLEEVQKVMAAQFMNPETTPNHFT